LKKTTRCLSRDHHVHPLFRIICPLFRLKVSEFTQVDRWGLVEGGHDVDIADLKVQMSSAVVFLGLSRGL
jgi:hypothetical protein